MKNSLKIVLFISVMIIALCCSSCQRRELDNGMWYNSTSNSYGVVDITIWAGAHVEILDEHDGQTVNFLGDMAVGLFELPPIYKTLILPETIDTISSNLYYNAPKSLQYNEYDNGLYLGTKDNPYFAFIKVKDVELPEAMSYKLDSGVNAPDKNGLPPPPYLNNPTDATSCIIHPDTKVIANEAFAGCAKLRSITIPGSIKVIPATAFGGCVALETVIIEEGVEIIRPRAFLDCESLVSISLPSTVKECNGAFDGCVYLKSITLPSSWTSIPEALFEDHLSIEKIVIPEGVLDIGKNAFANCASLKEITLPGTLEYIGEYAFYNCSALESIEIPKGVLEINESTFLSCSSLKEVKLHDGLERIGDMAFWECASLESIELPESLLTIGDGAFSGCRALTVLDIPKNVAVIGRGIISRCSEIGRITVDPQNIHYCSENGILYNFNKSTIIAYPPAYQADSFSIPESVTRIADAAFFDSSLKEIVIPEGVTVIGKYAFSSISNLKELIIPDSVISFHKIVNGATIERLVLGEGISWMNSTFFGECQVKEIYLPATVANIDIEALKGIAGLEKIVVDEDNKYYCSIDGNLYSKDKKTLIKYAHGKSEKEFTIPETVTTVQSYAFSKLENLESVIIPSNVKILEECAFSNGYRKSEANNLVNVTISNGVITIGKEAFYYCDKLKSVIIPDSVLSLGEYAFGECTSLEFAKIGNGVEEISAHAFRGCSSLSNVELGIHVKKIAKGSFSGCKSLAEIAIPKSVKVIEKSAFTQTMNFHYYGTKWEWRAAQKNFDLSAYGVKVHYVYCTNGKLTVRV